MVRGAGLEPARYFYHEPLKLACLPFHHPRTDTALARGLRLHFDYYSYFVLTTPTPIDDYFR